MEDAGTLIYDAYSLFQNSQSDVEATQESLKVNLHTETASSNLASAEMTMKKGLDKLSKGKKLKEDAENGFQSATANSDPLGPPPEAPKSWGEVDAMSMRASAKMRTLTEEMKEVKQSARSSHISLISVSSEKAVPVESFSDRQDDKLLDFLSKQF